MFRLRLQTVPQFPVLIHNLSRYAGQIPGGPDIRSTRAAMEEMVKGPIRERIAANFAGETAAGDDWEELSPNTPFMPYRRYHSAESAPILNVTGKLEKAALAFARWEFDGQRSEMFVPSDSFAGNVPYGYTMHEGGIIKSKIATGKRIPARPFFVVTSEDIDELQEMLGDYLQRRFDAVVPQGG